MGSDRNRGAENLDNLISRRVLILLLGAVVSRPMSAQQIAIECGGSLISEADACRGKVAAVDSLQGKEIVVRVVKDGSALAGASVRFRATSGTILPDSTTTDNAGRARVLWMRSKGSEGVAIAAEARAGGSSAVQYIQINPTLPPLAQLVMTVEGGEDQSWFERTQLRRPIDLNIRKLSGNDSVEINDEAVCAAQRVVFTRHAGAGVLSPDTSVAELFPIGPDRLGCYAWTNWTLGEGPGVRDIRATLLPGPGYQSKSPPRHIEATARALPRLIAGLVFARNREFLGVKEGSQKTIRVEQLLPDGSKLIYDSTSSTIAAIDTVKASTSTGMLAGVSIAVPIASLGRLDRLSLTAGVDLAHPSDDWYLGLSVGRLIDVGLEALPVDLHLLAHWGKDALLADFEACRTGISCKTKSETRFQGPAGMISVDATSLISELIKKLVP